MVSPSITDARPISRSCARHRLPSPTGWGSPGASFHPCLPQMPPGCSARRRSDPRATSSFQVADGSSVPHFGRSQSRSPPPKNGHAPAREAIITKAGELWQAIFCATDPGVPTYDRHGRAFSVVIGRFNEGVQLPDLVRGQAQAERRHQGALATIDDGLEEPLIAQLGREQVGASRAGRPRPDGWYRPDVVLRFPVPSALGRGRRRKGRSRP